MMHYMVHFVRRVVESQRVLGGRMGEREALEMEDASWRTRRVVCQWAVLGVCAGVVGACKAKSARHDTSAPVASASAQTPDRRVFFEEFVAKRVGHSRESKKYFELPARSRPPFALLLDYAVDTYGAVIIQVNGKEVVKAQSFPASGRYDDSRRVEVALTLSSLETNEVFTRIAAVGWGFAKLQVVGHWA